MSELDKINLSSNLNKQYFNIQKQVNRDKNKPHDNTLHGKDKIITKNINNKNYIYQNPKKTNKIENENIDPIQRPINIDDSNNIFYINHNGENKSIKIEPGEYSLTELSSAIQTKVNESFGMGKVKLNLTASGSDRFIKAEDKSIFDFINKEE